MKRAARRSMGMGQAAAGHASSASIPGVCVRACPRRLRCAPMHVDCWLGVPHASSPTARQLKGPPT